MRIEAHGLSRRFRRVVALRDVEFTIEPGERVALIGPNGSGKSTLTRILMGLIGFEGQVQIDGRSPRDQRVEIARRMAYVPQIAPRLAVPVRELLRAVAAVRGIGSDGPATVARELDLDLDSIGPRAFSQLSGGMKQKLLIALALGTGAELLILDEPTGSLDASSREHFYAVFEQRAPDATLLLCSHRLEEVRRLVDRVIALDEGRVSYDGPAAGFLRSSDASRIEVRARGEAAERWLAEHGFRREPGGWWGRTVTHAEKLKLLPDLTTGLGPGLEDLNVRELRGLEHVAPSSTRNNT